ncbi:hypothetical protein MBM_07477 [Drepanopeziza brunnea f. sp. 'multigermtubi' MB_m1]|uniref:Uncharacterized protein n=1 Tax=Marssonina brunnea f. sp. multigermtubi (strain MB_m1) TaxID=1072389 RepID=K1WPI0_MARBU|nr:uncharacterized protein MBM_07477 [Drepanopeziza brunnea f. sp. 'multigermtubi' MB_m1]EKD14247.1 hypothetical protein MBM_07477 [Drepanopeziza brunnea f. sp. 'multigermtubi' MB_m1]
MSPILEYNGCRIDEGAWERKFDLKGKGTDLNELFQEDHEDWTSDTSALASRPCCRELWRHLLLNGVLIKPAANGILHQKVLIDVLMNLDPIKWTLVLDIHEEPSMKKIEKEKNDKDNVVTQTPPPLDPNGYISRWNPPNPSGGAAGLYAPLGGNNGGNNGGNGPAGTFGPPPGPPPNAPPPSLVVVVVVAVAQLNPLLEPLLPPPPLVWQQVSSLKEVTASF